jgi:putative SOS response-associated peptidase YedK
MCGRYRLSRRKQLIAEYFETDNEVDWGGLHHRYERRAA